MRRQQTTYAELLRPSGIDADDGLAPISEERLSQLSQLTSHASTVSHLSQLSQDSPHDGWIHHAASSNTLEQGALSPQPPYNANVGRAAAVLVALQPPREGSSSPYASDRDEEEDDEEEDRPIIKQTRTQQRVRRRVRVAAAAAVAAASASSSSSSVRQMPLGDEEEAKEQLSSSMELQQPELAVESEQEPEHWFVYLIGIRGIPESRTNLSARRYEGDDVSMNLEDELTHCNDTTNSLYQHNTLRMWRKKQGCPDAEWRYLCFVDGFTSEAAAIRFMELAKYKNFINRTRFNSMLPEAKTRMSHLTNQAGQPLMAAIRWMIEALWLTLHDVRAPGAKKGQGYPPADRSSYLPHAQLRWVWLNANVVMSQAMSDVLQPLQNGQLTVESWAEEEEEEPEQEPEQDGEGDE